KPLRREGRVAPVEPVVSNSCAFYTCTRGRGCNQHPVFPAPSLKRDDEQNITRAIRVARMLMCASVPGGQSEACPPFLHRAREGGHAEPVIGPRVRADPLALPTRQTRMTA